MSKTLPTNSPVQRFFYRKTAKGIVYFRLRAIVFLTKVFHGFFMVTMVYTLLLACAPLMLMHQVSHTKQARIEVSC